MKSIIIWQRRSNKIGSRVIRWATGEYFSHIGIQLSSDGIYHSDTKGCRIVSIEDFCHKSEHKYIIKTVSDKEHEDMTYRANKRLGDSYDSLGALGFGLLLLLAKRLNIKIKMPTFNPKWLFCSEYSEYILWGTQGALTPGAVADKADFELINLSVRPWYINI